MVGQHFSRDPMSLEPSIVCLIVGIGTIPAPDRWRRCQLGFLGAKSR